MIGAPDGAAERAVGAVRALARAREATATAVRLLDRTADVDWTGPGAAAFRDDLAGALAEVRRTGVRLAEAEAAAADHLGAVRAEDARREAELRAAAVAGTGPGAGGLHPWGGVPVPDPPGPPGLPDPLGPPGPAGRSGAGPPW